MKKKIILGLLLSLIFLGYKTEIVHGKIKETSKLSVEEIVNKMSEKEKIGQLMMVDFRYWNGKPFITMNEEVEKVIKDYKFGGIILFRENVKNKVQGTNLVNKLQQSTSNFPLFIGIDQEGGYVTRLQDGTEMPGNMALGAANDYENTKEVGAIIGKELNALGVNMNFGPVVDVNSNQKNPVIGVRSFGDNPKAVGNMANAYIDGLHSENIMATLKHFPGHGNTASDTHVGLATVNYSRSQWEKIDKVPFEMAINNGADLIMTAHVLVPSLDNMKVKSKKDGALIGLPATLSKPIMTGILRGKMKFKGLIITDALNMDAISENFGESQAIIRSILAGADIVLMPTEISNVKQLKNLDKIYSDISLKMKGNKELSRRVEESVKRIIELKMKKGLMKTENLLRNPEYANKIIGSKGNKLVEKNAAERGITLIKNENILPMDLTKNKKVLFIAETRARGNIMENEAMKIEKDIKIRKISANYKNGLTEEIKKEIKNSNYIVLATYNLKKNTRINEIIEYANKNKKKLVTVSTRNPYDIIYTPRVKANIAIYGITGFDITNNSRNSLEANIRAGIRTIFVGEDKIMLNNPTAKLPIDIKDDTGKILYNRGFGLNY